MENERKEITMEQLMKLVQSQEGEFIIHVEPGGENAYGDTKTGGCRILVESNQG